MNSFKLKYGFIFTLSICIGGSLFASDQPVSSEQGMPHIPSLATMEKRP